MSVLTDDFSAWLNAAKSCAGSIASFGVYVKDIEWLLTSIATTGFLPLPIALRTEAFISDVYNIFAKKLPFLPKPGVKEMPVVVNLAQILLKFSIYGIKNCEKLPMDIALAILDVTDGTLFARNDLQSNLKNFFIDQGAWKPLNDILENHGQSLEIVMSALKIIHLIKDDVSAFSLPKYIDMSSVALERVVRRDMKKCDVSLLHQCIIQIMKAVGKQQIQSRAIMTSQIALVAEFCGFDMFQQKMAALSALQSYCTDKSLGPSVIAYFATDGAIMLLLNNLKCSTFHVEYAEPLGVILGYLSCKAFGAEFIRDVWNYHRQIHPGEVKYFYDMFIRIMGFVNTEKLALAVTCVLEEEATPEWIAMATKTCNELKSRDKDHIRAIRSRLLDLACTNDYEFVQKARDGLMEIVAVEADASDFQNIADIVMNRVDDEFKYLVMEKMLQAARGVKLSFATYDQMLAGTIERLVNATVKTTELTSLIQSICDSGNVTLTAEQFDMLYGVRTEFTDFFDFMKKIAEVGSISTEICGHICAQVQPCEIDMSFFKFLEETLKQLNMDKSQTVIEFPLTNEDLLWDYALKASPVRSHFAGLLCDLYGSNDSQDVSDQTIISLFLDRWETLFTDSEHDRDFLMELLTCFVETVECQVDRIPDRHWLGPPVYVSVMNDDSRLDIRDEFPSFTSIGAVIQRVVHGKWKINSIELALSETDNELPRRTRLTRYATSAWDDRSQEMRQTLRLRVKKTSRRNKRYHVRDRVPSQDIHGREWEAAVVNFMKEGNVTAYELLKVLPVVPTAVRFTDPEELDCHEICQYFPCQWPFVLAYNLGTFVTDVVTAKRERELRRDTLTYLAKHLVQVMPLTARFPNGDDITYAFLSICSIFSSDIFDTEGRVAMFDVLTSILLAPVPEILKRQAQFFLTRFYQRSDRRLDFPMKLAAKFQALIINDSHSVRSLSVSLLDSWRIPVEMFERVIRDMNDLGWCTQCGNVEADFMNVVSRHLADFDENSIAPLFDAIVPLVQHVHGLLLNNVLSLIAAMLGRGTIPRESQLVVLDILISRFLHDDVVEADKAAVPGVTDCFCQLADLDDSGELILRNELSKHHSYRYPLTNHIGCPANGDECCRTGCGQAGLRNLGQTCYLNATLQQFFAVECIRNVVMSYEGETRLLLQLRKLFAYMKHVQTREIDPRFVVDSWLCWGTTPLDPHVQQDAVEFVQGFLDQYTTQESTNPVKQLMSDLCHGIVVHHHDGISVAHHSMRDEIFTTYDLDVRSDIKDIYQAFDSVAKSELLKDYDSVESGRIDVRHYTRIGKAPPVLILHLKRFEYLYLENKRKKLEDRLDVLKEIDISRYCEEPTSPYFLNGVIVHRGSAMGGHYISLVKAPNDDDNSWLCFNDNVVTPMDFVEVLKDSNGNGDCTGYILFYIQKIPAMITDEPELPEDIKNEITALNAENQLLTRYCTAGYHRLMVRIGNRVDGRYLGVCLRYAVNTLPFSKTGLDTDAFFDVLASGLMVSKECAHEYISYVNSDFLIYCLFLSGIECVRRGHVKLISAAMKAFNEWPTEMMSLTDAVLDMTGNCVLKSYRQIDQLFEVLVNMYDFSEAVRSVSVTKKWNEAIVRTLIKDPITWAELNPAIRHDYFLSGFNIAHVLELAVRLQLDQESKTALMSCALLRDICITPSSCESVARYTHGFGLVRDFMALTASDGFSGIRMYRAVSLIAYTIPSAFDVLFQTKFVVGDGLSSDAELAACFVALATCSEPFRRALVENWMLWLWRFLFSANESARDNVVSLLAHVTRMDDFPEPSRAPAAIPALILPSVSFTSEAISVEMRQFVTMLLVELLDREHDLATAIGTIDIPNAQKGAVSEYRALQYLTLVDVFLRVANDINVLSAKLSNIIHLFRVMCDDKKAPFNRQIISAMEIIARYQLPITYDTLMNAFPGAGKARLATSSFPGLCGFLPHFAPVLMRFPPDSRFMGLFMEQILFAKYQDTVKCQAVILDIMSFYCESGKPWQKEMIRYVSSKLRLCGKRNFPMLLTFCEKMGRREHLIGIFIDLFNTPTSCLYKTTLDIDSLLIRSLALVNKDRGLMHDEMAFLSSLLTSDAVKLSASSRALISEHVPNFSNGDR